MTSQLAGSLLAVVATIGVLVPAAASGQAPATRAGCPTEPAKFHPCAIERAKSFDPPRTAWGVPNLQGFWTKGRFNIEAHPAEGPPGASGSFGAAPTLIVDPPDGRIPYLPWAAAQKKVNFEKHIAPIVQCFLPGIPHQIHTAGGFQVVQTPQYTLVLSEFYGTTRVIPMDGRPHVGPNIRLWMGDSRGRWEGNTLVVEATNFNARNWLDRVGNFYSSSARIVERWTLVDVNTIHYQATIEDPSVYTRPWTMAFDIPRITEQGHELIEQACHEGDRDTPHLLDIGYTPYRGITPP